MSGRACVALHAVQGRICLSDTTPASCPPRTPALHGKLPCRVENIDLAVPVLIVPIKATTGSARPGKGAWAKSRFVTKGAMAVKERKGSGLALPALALLVCCGRAALGAVESAPTVSQVASLLQLDEAGARSFCRTSM